MRKGFSLLEVLLAMSILLGAIIILGELTRMGRQHAAGARDRTQAQLLCQSVVNEIVAGTRLAEPAVDLAFEDRPDWLYSIQREPLERPGIAAWKISVRQDLPEEKKPIRYSMVRWVRSDEPGFGQDAGSQQDLARAGSAADGLP